VFVLTIIIIICFMHWFYKPDDLLMIAVYHDTSLSWYQFIMIPVYHDTSLSWYHSIMIPVYHNTILSWYQSIIIPVYQDTSLSWYRTNLSWYQSIMIPVRIGTLLDTVWRSYSGKSMRDPILYLELYLSVIRVTETCHFAKIIFWVLFFRIVLEGKRKGFCRNKYLSKRKI